MGKVSHYLRHHLTFDLLAVIGGWPEPRTKARDAPVEPDSVPPAHVQDEWPLLENQEWPLLEGLTPPDGKTGDRKVPPPKNSPIR
jgi:hypothetical protein